MRRRGTDLVGRPAGIATRSAAYLLDIVIAFAAYVVVLTVGGFAWSLVVEDRLEIDVYTNRTNIWSLGFIAFWVIYLWFWWALDGRSPGKGLAGLRLVRRDGGAPGRGSTLVRALLYTLLPPPLFSTPFVLFGRERRGLHDIVCRTRVVYDWGTRPVRPRTPKRLQLPADTASEAP